MVRVVGVDPGTKSFDFCGLEDGNLFLDKTIPSTKIAENPAVVVELLNSARPLDLIVGPSGYGLPLTHIKKIGEREQFLLTLVRPGDLKTGAILGLRKMVKMLGEEDLNVYFVPSVIHMPTIPAHRKANKIDMGTADKLCCAVLGVYDQAKHLGISYKATAFILVEIGFGYNAIIGVEKGAIIDGIGGTTAGPGFLTLGGMDGELAYLLGAFGKETLFQGGATYIAGNEKVMPEDFAKKAETNAQYRTAWDAFFEGIEKNVAEMSISVKKPKEILISGRLSRINKIYQEAFRRLSCFGTVRKVEGFARVAKEAAQGAALIADGLAGGQYMDLVDDVKIREAGGTVFDYIYLKEDLKRKYGI